jgi:hypothetical protein
MELRTGTWSEHLGVTSFTDISIVVVALKAGTSMPKTKRLGIQMRFGQQVLLNIWLEICAPISCRLGRNRPLSFRS